MATSTTNPSGYYLPHDVSIDSKVFIIYPHNPEGYIFIEPPDERQILLRNPGLSREQIQADYLRECKENEERQEKLMKTQAELVYRFATFLQENSVPVAYDQLLTDRGCDNIMKWSQEQINDSKFIILVITESFSEYLRNEVPGTEPIFTGDFLFNLVHDPHKPLVPVFLNQIRDESLLEGCFNMTTLYTIFEPFNLSEDRTDDFRALYARLTDQDQHPAPNPLPDPPVDVQEKSTLFKKRGSNKMNQRQSQVYAVLSTNHLQVTDHVVRTIAQKPDFNAYWKSLAKQLEVSEAEVVRIVERCGRDQSEMCLELLNVWRGRKQEQAVVSKLAEAAMKTGRFVMLEVLNVACVPS